jgi:hypothetical protein
VKRAELLQHAKCNVCGKGIGASCLPLFWRVTIERFGVDLPAVKRQDALGAFMGNQAIAAVMGPNEDLAKPVMDPVTLTVCETCAVGRDLPVAALSEVATQREEQPA